jgi:CheY-like chemotaxis protein
LEAPIGLQENAIIVTLVAVPTKIYSMKPHYRLLIVEDSAEDVELLLHHLRDARFTFSSSCVETEADYRAALLAELPQLVLCDYHLPRFSAARALEILQERALEIPFIVVSHHIGGDAAVDAMRNGASDYLLKNRLARLAKAIEVAVERRESAEQKALADAALRDSEAMKRGILNSLNTRIAVLNGSGRILAANKSWEDFSDCQPRRRIGGPAFKSDSIDYQSRNQLCFGGVPANRNWRREVVYGARDAVGRK